MGPSSGDYRLYISFHLLLLSRSSFYTHHTHTYPTYRYHDHQKRITMSPEISYTGKKFRPNVRSSQLELLCTQQQSITPFTNVLHNVAGLLTNARVSSYQSQFLGNTQDLTSGFICIYMGEGWAAGGTTPLHLKASQHFPSLFVYFIACAVIFNTPARELTTILYRQRKAKAQKHSALSSSQHIR